MITQQGKPLRIDGAWFRARYGAKFPDILDAGNSSILDSCIEDVYTLFNGVSDLWSHLERSLYEDKTRMCYGLLVAWYITDLFPEYASSIATMGGMPIKMKSIGGVKIQFGEVSDTTAGAVNNADLLQALKSNAYGCKAYMMIKTSGKLNLYIGR